jgi:hypothetical protein
MRGVYERSVRERCARGLCERNVREECTRGVYERVYSVPAPYFALLLYLLSGELVWYFDGESMLVLMPRGRTLLWVRFDTLEDEDEDEVPPQIADPQRPPAPALVPLPPPTPPPLPPPLGDEY